MSVPRTTRFSLGRVACVVAATVLGGAANGQIAVDEAAALRSYYSGNGLLNRGMYDLAAHEYRRFLEDHPDHLKATLARYGLAVSLFRSGNYAPAVQQLEALGTPDDFEYAAEVLVITGQSRLVLGDPARAAEAFGQVLREHPEHGLADEAAALHAEALYEARRFEEVERPCRLLATRWPDSPHRERAELFGGLAQLARGRFAAAAERFDAMIAMYPDGDHADRVVLLRAQSLHRAERVPDAVAGYRDVIRRARDEFVPDAMYGLAVLLNMTRRHAEAGTVLDGLLRRYPDDDVVPAAQLMRGRVWFDVEQYERAGEVFEELSRQDGDYRDDAAYWSAKSMLRRGDASGAARALEQALANFPDSELVPQMSYDRAVALLGAGEPGVAITVLEEFRSASPEHDLAADALQLEAAAHHQQRRYRESLARCETFHRRYPGHELSPAVDLLAAENTYFLEDYEAAVPRYESFLGRHPDHEQAGLARFRLGMALHRQERFGDARPWLESVVDGRDTEQRYRSALLAAGDGEFQRDRWPAAEQHLRDYLSFGLDQPGADDALLKLGLAQQRQGDRDGALETFGSLIDQRDDSPHRLHGLFERGQVLVELDRHDEARTAFEQVLEQGPESPFAGHAMNHLGALALRDDDFGEAALFFGSAAASLGSGDAAAEALFQQGRALMAARRYDRAENVLSTLLGSYPSHERTPRASALQAVALSRLDGDDEANHQVALAAIERVEARYLGSLEPALRASLWYEKAWCLRELGRHDDAAQTYRRVLDQEPPEQRRVGDVRDHATLELAELEVDAERYQEAATLLRRLERRTGGSKGEPRLHRQVEYRLGLCEFHLGRHVQAATLLESWLGDEPDAELVPSAQLLCAESLLSQGRYDRAIEHLDRLVEANPGNESYGPGLLRLGSCHAELQNWPSSERAFATYLQRFGDSELWFQAQFGIGWALENQGRYEDAMAVYRLVTARHQGPTAARAQFQIGECLFAQKRYDDAVRELIKVDILYAYPQWSAAALYEAGRCFQETGNPVDARAQYNQVRRDYGDTNWADLARRRLDELADSALPGH